MGLELFHGSVYGLIESLTAGTISEISPERLGMDWLIRKRDDTPIKMNAAWEARRSWERNGVGKPQVHKTYTRPRTGLDVRMYVKFLT